MAKRTDLYQAIEAFGVMYEGEQITVQKGDLVRAGHPLLKQCRDRFEPAEGFIRFDVEQATAAPGEKRGEEHSPAPGEKKESKSK